MFECTNHDLRNVKPHFEVMIHESGAISTSLGRWEFRPSESLRFGILFPRLGQLEERDLLSSQDACTTPGALGRFVSPLTSASGTEAVLRVSTMDVSNDVLKRRLLRFIFAFGARGW